MRAQHSFHLLVSIGLSLIALGAAAFAQDTSDPAWDNAAKLKKSAAYGEAAKAFETWAREHAQDPRANEAIFEAAQCRFSNGRALQKAQRNTPESLDELKAALVHFGKIAALDPPVPNSGRAQYMRGSTYLFMGDMAKAESEYTLTLDKFKTDEQYVPKALEKRALVRRNLLRTKDSIADLQRFQKEYPKAEGADAVGRYLQYSGMFDKPAPQLTTETWVQGTPATLATFKGDVVVLFFFATWCSNCEGQRPFMLDLIERYEPMGVHFIGVTDHSEKQTADSVRAWLPGKKYGLPVMIDNGQTARSYMGSKLPDVVIIDRAGRVRWHDHPANLQDSTIETLLLEDPAAK